jgi:hypothetical protein
MNNMTQINAWQPSWSPIRHQSNEKPIAIRRGEGGGAGEGEPLWSPATVALER